MPDAPAINPIAALKRFSKPRETDECCELCAAPLSREHQHLLEPAKRQLVCACDACAILFSQSRDGRYRRVPRTIEHWQDFQITDTQWAGLGVPIALAFFFQSTAHEQLTAVYPSPGGATETLLPVEVWAALSEENPALARLEPDVEALLVNRMNGARDYFRVPIDECYKLVGIVRMSWHGLSGGAELWKKIADYFENLKARSSTPSTNA